METLNVKNRKMPTAESADRDRREREEEGKEWESEREGFGGATMVALGMVMSNACLPTICLPTRAARSALPGRPCIVGSSGGDGVGRGWGAWPNPL